jgi:hypothetical protein
LAIFSINVEPGLIKELIEVLRQIACGIDRAYPPGPDPEARKKMKPHGPEDIVQFNPEEEWQREEEEEVRQRS